MQRLSFKIVCCPPHIISGLALSFVLQVNHIVLFDFPLNLADYLHRVGRTGRVGSQVTRPRVSAFMSHRKDVEMALKIKDAATRQVAIMEKRAVNVMSRKQAASAKPEGTQTETRTHEVDRTEYKAVNAF